MATVYCAVAMAASARSDDVRAVAHAPADLVRWHSGLANGHEAGAKPEWRSSITTIDPAYLVMHGAAGLRFAADDAPDYSSDPFLPTSSRIGILPLAR
jgi:hypothetical protein